MGSACGIELGPASCVLVSARAGAAGADVDAVQVIESATWPGTDFGVVALLKQVRRAGKFPRRARVVAWSLERPASTTDAAGRAAIKTVTAAGFRVEAVLTPAEALALVATSRKRSNEGPIAWLAVNMHGAAIAIVKGTEILYARSLQWHYSAGAQSVKEQLLQRYSLVTHIAPELKHGIEQVRRAHGGRVETIVTCGDLPDLRSLTMPLIEELDLEVETLDSSEGLLARGAAAQDRFAEWAPAIRLACAAALVPVKRHFWGVPALVAGGLMVVAAIALYKFVDRAPVVSIGSRVHAPAASPAPVNPPQETTVQRVTPPPVQETSPAPPPAAAAAAPPPDVPTRPAPSTAKSTPTVKASSPEKIGGQRLPPVPPLTSILIDNGRRLAMMGGTIVAVGDKVGPRVVVRIEPNAVVLREPTGAEITVLLRTDGVDAVKSVPFLQARPITGTAP